MTTFAILLGGKAKATERLSRQLQGVRVIAADSGMALADVLRVSPELWVGDFDSTPKTLAEKWRAVPRQTHTVEKDASDGELAISEALRRGATALILVGGMGGQLDHQLAHLGFLLSLAKQGVTVMMTSGTEEAYALFSELSFLDLTPGSRLSVMPVSDLHGLSISGVKWPLTKRLVKLGSALTLANVVTGKVEITLVSGQAVVVVSPA